MKLISKPSTYLFIAALSLSPVWGQGADSWSRFDDAAVPATAQQDPAYAQNTPAPPPPPADAQPQPMPMQQQQPQYAPPAQGGSYGQSAYDQRPAPPLPATLNLPAGKYLTVRMNSFLTTDRNQPGDAFTASLVEPLVIDGFVVAHRGQIVNGRVVDVKKAGRVAGTSSMRVELTELLLADGQQLPIHTQLVYRQGPTSVGRDASAIGGTTALGAIVGAAATGTGFGAGMGAIGGAVVGTIGVLVTRGRPTVIHPESVLTFRIEQPLAISTVNSGGAFEPVTRQDYNANGFRPARPGGPGYGYAPAPYPAYAYPAYPYPYAYGYGYGWGGPFIGVGFYGRGYYGRGWGGRWR
ncbi:hypothetical protein [Nevskia soli]|jgi:hypothetical protein|uniref:hypothetical protein n=1 Tax=Nevskia soli TaxID=418856 RepID=UPI0015D87678|nr:hypothetical protein [Nevskia soli]